MKCYSDSLDSKSDVTDIDIQECIELYKVNTSTKILELCDGYHGKIFKIFEQLTIEKKNKVTKYWIII